MKKKPHAAAAPDFAPNLAAQYLASHLGDTVDLWLYRLANWRRPGRQAPLAATRTEAGHPVYAFAELEKFVVDERARRVLVSGGGGVGTQPRAGATAKIDGPEEPHVRVLFAIGAVSQSVFAIDQLAARRLADMLSRSASIVERATVGGA